MHFFPNTPFAFLLSMNQISIIFYTSIATLISVVLVVCEWCRCWQGYYDLGSQLTLLYLCPTVKATQILQPWKQHHVKVEISICLPEASSNSKHQPPPRTIPHIRVTDSISTQRRGRPPGCGQRDHRCTPRRPHRSLRLGKLAEVCKIHGSSSGALGKQMRPEGYGVCRSIGAGPDAVPVFVAVS